MITNYLTKVLNEEQQKDIENEVNLLSKRIKMAKGYTCECSEELSTMDYKNIHEIIYTLHDKDLRKTSQLMCVANDSVLDIKENKLKLYTTMNTLIEKWGGMVS